MTAESEFQTAPSANVSGAANYRVVVCTRDGRPIVIRAIRPQDKASLREAFAKLEEQTIQRRFFGAKKELNAQELRWATEIDFVNHVALVAVVEAPGKESIIAVGRYVTLASEPGRAKSAEVAFIVEEDFQGQGIATLLLRRLAAIAREYGVTQFEAEILPDNQAMLRVFEQSGMPMTVTSGLDSLHVVLLLSVRIGT